MANNLARSIKRTLEVLEYFDEERTAASVGEISKDLDYPQSSTSVLLKSLMSLGYLSYNEGDRTYRPTARVALLGRGLRHRFFGEGSVETMMDELSQRTGELVILAARHELSVHYIHVIAATSPLRMHVRAGAVRPLVGAAVGHLFLAQHTDAEIDKLIQRSVAAFPNRVHPPREDIFRDVTQVRETGHIFSTSTVTPGGCVLGMMLPRHMDEQELAICIGGVEYVLTANADRLTRDLREVVQQNS